MLLRRHLRVADSLATAAGVDVANLGRGLHQYHCPNTKKCSLEVEKPSIGFKLFEGPFAHPCLYVQLCSTKRPLHFPECRDKVSSPAKVGAKIAARVGAD